MTRTTVRPVRTTFRTTDTDRGGLSPCPVSAACPPRQEKKEHETHPPITERAFQREVTDLAYIFGWTLYHPALSKWSERGWPDLALCRPPRLVCAELKRENGKPTLDQDRWLGLLRACPGVETYLWRPSDLDTIASVLR